MSLKDYINKQRQAEIDNDKNSQRDKILENIRRKDLTEKIENCFLKVTKDLYGIKQQNKEFEYEEETVVKQNDDVYSKNYVIKITPLRKTQTYFLTVSANLNKEDEGITISISHEDINDVLIIPEDECSFDEFLAFDIEEFIIDYLEDN